jgi:GDP-4-dehydro-6-deoxy-D-mannose reductase
MVFGNQDRVLVTGAAGFVGKYCIDALLEAGLPAGQVYALSRKGESPPAKGVEAAVGDVLDFRAMKLLLTQLKPTALIHLAAIAEPAKARADPKGAWEVNFDAVRHLAESVLEVSPDTRLVFAGSAEAYGESFNRETLPISEGSALRPMTTYGATKAAADVLLGQMAHDGLKVVRFRAFNHTGPGQSPAYVVAAFAEQVALIEAGLQPPILRVGNLNGSRDFLDVRDVVQAYVRACHHPLDWRADNVFNIASSTPRTIWSILEGLTASSTCEITIEIDQARLRPNDVKQAFGDNSSAKARLGWSPAVPFDDTLQAVLEFWREQV